MTFISRSALTGALGAALALGLVAVLAPPATPVGAQLTSVDAAMEALRQEAHQARAAAERAQVLAVVYQVDGAGLHDLDESVQAGAIPAGSLGRVRRTRIAVESVAWPQSIRETAHELAAHLRQLESAIRDEDVEAATGPAHEAHEVGHDLSGAAYAWLSGAQPSPGGGH